MNTFYIAAAAPCGNIDFSIEPGDVVAACDLGLEACVKSGIKPDVVVGDFDSLGAVPSGDFELIKLPVEKDDTDLTYAVKLGLERGFKRFVIYGALGGRRYDHTLANAHLLSFIAQSGALGYIVTEYGDTLTAVCNSRIVFDSACAGDMGLLSFSDNCRGVTIEGFKYEGRFENLKSTDLLTVSNSFTGRKAFVEVKDGTLIIFYTGKPSQTKICRL